MPMPGAPPMMSPGGPPGGAPGAPPPGFPGGTGAAAAPGPQMGGQQMAMTALQVALEALQKALPGLPMGSELHTKVLKSVQDLSKSVAEAGAAQDQSAKMQQLVAMARSSQQQPQQQAMMRAFPANANAAPPAQPAAAA
jgi:hypothetical protein